MRERILTNIEILNLTEVPKTLAIIGAGAVGVEFASIFNRFGTKVTILEMLPRLVPVEDEEVSKELERYFKKTGIRVETGAKADNIENTGSGVRFDVTLANGKTEADGGRRAAGRGRPQAQHREHRPGEYKVSNSTADSSRWTRISARRAGSLRHRRYRRGHAATGARGDDGRHGRGRAHGRQAGAFPSTGIAFPAATYTEPGIGSVGLTEAQARAAGFKVKIGNFPFAANSKASHPGQARRLREDRRRRKIRRDPGRPHHRTARLSS